MSQWNDRRFDELCATESSIIRFLQSHGLAKIPTNCSICGKSEFKMSTYCGKVYARCTYSRCLCRRSLKADVLGRSPLTLAQWMTIIYKWSKNVPFNTIVHDGGHSTKTVASIMTRLQTAMLVVLTQPWKLTGPKLFANVEV